MPDPRFPGLDEDKLLAAVDLVGRSGGMRRQLRGRVCAWKRAGRRWERGCVDRIPEGERRIRRSNQ